MKGFGGRGAGESLRWNAHGKSCCRKVPRVGEVDARVASVGLTPACLLGLGNGGGNSGVTSSMVRNSLYEGIGVVRALCRSIDLSIAQVGHGSEAYFITTTKKSGGGGALLRNDVDGL